MSRIEQLISDIEAYIDNCKYQPFSNNKIIVDKDQLEDMLSELRLKTPDEIKKYQKILNNKDAIISDAKEQAEDTGNYHKQRRVQELAELAGICNHPLIERIDLGLCAHTQANGQRAQAKAGNAHTGKHQTARGNIAPGITERGEESNHQRYGDAAGQELGQDKTDTENADDQDKACFSLQRPH